MNTVIYRKTGFSFQKLFTGELCDSTVRLKRFWLINYIYSNLHWCDSNLSSGDRGVATVHFLGQAKCPRKDYLDCVPRGCVTGFKKIAL